MKVMLTGAAGQLGCALLVSQPRQLGGEPLELIATSRSGGHGSVALDLADAEACRAAVDEHQPDWVINAGAFTAVDGAEAEPHRARAVNALGPQALAQAVARGKGRLLQLSTDFVFNGMQGSPYRPEQPPDPLGVYGATKAEGEHVVLEALGPERSSILRTGWVYGPHGHNFLLTMLRLQRQRSASGEPLRVVADQVGCPTSTAGLAQACWQALVQPRPILHWSDAGAASWYDFAMAIADLGVELGVLDRVVPVEPITTADYPTPAQRPAYSLLDCSASRRALGLPAQHWRQALQAVLAGMATA